MDLLRYARRHHLDLSVRQAFVSVAAIDTFWHGPVPEEMIDSEFIDLFRRCLRIGWPKGLPFVVLACGPGDQCLLIDGRHRLEHAKRAGWTELPVLITSRETWEELQPHLDEYEMFDEYMDVFARSSSVMLHNIELEQAWTHDH